MQEKGFHLLHGVSMPLMLSDTNTNSELPVSGEIWSDVFNICSQPLVVVQRGNLGCCARSQG